VHGCLAGLPVLLPVLAGCAPEPQTGPTRLAWHVFHEPSGAFERAAAQCSAKSAGRYVIEIEGLPAEADQQREQLVRRLAARDASIDVVGLDVIWTAEFAAAGWILKWPESRASPLRSGRIKAAVESASYSGGLWAVPLSTNAQLLWYREDRVAEVPATWNALLERAEAIGVPGTLQLQGQRYEGLTVFFVSLLSSAGGAVLDPSGAAVSLDHEPTRRALEIMRRVGRSPAADPALATSREDDARLAFESGSPAFMLNYSFVWPSARSNAPQVADHMGWARWPAVLPERPSRVAIGGVNLGVAAFSLHPELAFDAATCLAGDYSQRLAATLGGLPPTSLSLYEDPAVLGRFPFARLLRTTLEDAVARPSSPVYSDISLAISRTLHPMSRIDPDRDVERLRSAVERALRSEGLF
jgi:multiple sugar transport system substrate-binding protein